MNQIEFITNPDLDRLGAVFSHSPYFCRESLVYKEKFMIPRSGIIVAIVGDSIAGALSWQAPQYEGILKIGEVEVIESYRGHHIGSSLLLAAEKIPINTYTAIGYLNTRTNSFSRNMFLQAGYTQKDDLKFYKNL